MVRAWVVLGRVARVGCIVAAMLLLACGSRPQDASLADVRTPASGGGGAPQAAKTQNSNTSVDGAAATPLVRFVGAYTGAAAGRPAGCRMRPADIDPTRFTHLVYRAANLTAAGPLAPPTALDADPNGGWVQFNGLKTAAPGLRTLLAVGAEFDATSNAAFATVSADAGRRATFVASAIKTARDAGFDGLELDWLFPALDGSSKANYMRLLADLRTAITREATGGRAALLLTAAGHSGPLRPACRNRRPDAWAQAQLFIRGRGYSSYRPRYFRFQERRRCVRSLGPGILALDS